MLTRKQEVLDELEALIDKRGGEIMFKVGTYIVTSQFVLIYPRRVWFDMDMDDYFFEYETENKDKEIEYLEDLNEIDLHKILEEVLE